MYLVISIIMVIRARGLVFRGVKKIHLRSEKISQMYLLGLSSIQVGHGRCIPQVYPGRLQMYLFAKKKFHGGIVNPVITQLARMVPGIFKHILVLCPRILVLMQALGLSKPFTYTVYLLFSFIWYGNSC